MQDLKLFQEILQKSRQNSKSLLPVVMSLIYYHTTIQLKGCKFGWVIVIYLFAKNE